MENEQIKSELVLSSGFGQYIPQIFAENNKKYILDHFENWVIDSLLNGFEDEYYWEAWELVLNNYELNNMILIHDQDLWLVDTDQASEWEHI